MICFGCWPFVAKRACIKGGFHDVHALFHIVVHNVHVRYLIKCLLGIFSLVWTPMSTKLWGFSYFLIRNMFGSLVVYLTHLAPHVHFLYFGHALHITTSYTHLLIPLLCIGLYLVSSSQHVMFILCFVVFCFVLDFELHFLILLAPFMHYYHCSYIHLFPLFLLDPLSSPDKKGDSIFQRVYRSVLSFLNDSCAHPQGKKFNFSCTFVGGRYSIREMHIPRGKRHCVNQKTLFCLFSCWLYSALSYALLFSSHRVYVLNMHTFFMPCALLIVRLDDHLLC